MIADSASYDSLTEFWDDYLEKADHVSDDVIGFLILNDVCTEHLAHLDLDDQWLFQLMRKNDEALKTLIVRYYSNGTKHYHSKHATVAQFKAFLVELKLPEALQWLRESDMKEWINALEPDDSRKAAIMHEFMLTYA